MISEILPLVFLAPALVGLPYGAGMVPLTGPSYEYWIPAMSIALPVCLSGTLLGLGLGVVIPEGVKAVVKANRPEDSSGHAHFPTTTIAISLLVGFTFMFLTEQLLPGANSRTSISRSLSPGYSTGSLRPPPTRTATRDGLRVSVFGNGFAIALGLVLRALPDGLAIGSSMVAHAYPQEAIISILVVQGVGTAFALTASLSASGVNREDCKKYLAIFSTATITIAAIFRCLLQPTDGGKNDWTGIAMLISGGSFLYIPAVLQRVSSSKASGLCEYGISMKLRLGYAVGGMFIPLIFRAISEVIRALALLWSPA